MQDASVVVESVHSSPPRRPQCPSVCVVTNERQDDGIAVPRKFEQQELCLWRHVAGPGAPLRRHPPELASCSSQEPQAAQLQRHTILGSATVELLID